MKKIVTFLLFLSMCSFVFAQNLRITENSYQKVAISFDVDTLSVDDITMPTGIFSRISMADYGSSNNPGDPQLPQLAKLLQIPVCDSVIVTIVNAQYTEYDAANLGINHPLYPAQPSVSKSSIPQFTYNQATYATNAFYALPLVSVEKAGIKRDIALANMYVTPVQYNPVTQKIRIYHQIDVEFTFVNTNMAATNNLQKYASPMFSLDKSMVVNVKENTAKGPEYMNGAPIKYLIIANSMFSSNAKLAEFVAWKKRLGYIVEVAYTNDANVGTTTTSIKNFIQNKYNNATTADPAPTFLLLIGDVTNNGQLPTFDSQNTGNGDSDHKTDLYYATLAGNDNIPDCYYGRLSAQSDAHLTNQLTKILMYEQYTMPDPSYLGNAVLIAGTDQSATVEGHSRTHADGQINYIFSNYVNTNSSNPYDYTTVYKHNYYCSDQAATIRSEINAGVGLANYTAHGSSSGWSDPSFSTSNVQSMTNTGKYGLLIGNCCQSGTFYDNECFGEALLRKYSDRGAMGYIGASNYSYWNEDVYWAVGVRSNSEISNSPTTPFTYSSSRMGMYDKLFHTHNEAQSTWVSTIGGILQGGNLAVQSSSSGYRHYYWEIYHCFGDPSVRVYLGMPHTMNVTAASRINTSSASYTATVAPYAYTALKKNGTEFVAAAFANANGSVTLSLPSSLDEGAYELVAVAQNYIPYFKDVEVLDDGSCSSPRNLTCTELTATAATLEWTQSAGTATNWVLQYGTSENFSNGTYQQMNISNNPIANLTGLTSEVTYYARVKANCGGTTGESNWSVTCSFLPSAVQTITIGNGETTNSNLPSNNYYNYSLTQQLYTPEEIGMAGTIKSIAFNKNSTNAMNRNLDIYMVNTDKTSFGSNTDWISVTTSDKVFSGNVSFSDNDWTTITLDNPFAYDGSSHLAIIVDDNTGSYVSTTNFLTYSATNQAIRIYSDGTDYDPASPSSYSGTRESSKNQIQLVIVPTSTTCAAPESISTSNTTPFSSELAWTGGSGHYNIEIKAGSNDWVSVATNVSAQSYALTNLSDNTTYQARVQSVCGSETSTYKTAYFSTPVACPKPTTLSLNTLTNTSATLNWTENGSATSWQICLNNDESNLINVTTNPYTVTGLTPETIYTAKVRANCGSIYGQSQWSEPCTFNPTNKTTIGSGTATNSYLPTNNFYKYSLTQQIFTAEELGTAGTIQSIDFYKNNTTECARNLDIYMVSTDKSSFTSGSDWIPVTSSDKVFSGIVTFADNNWTTIELDNDFVYNGSENVAIIVDDNTGSYKSTTPFLAFSAANQALRVFNDNTNFNPESPSGYSGSIENTKNQIRLQITASSGSICERPESMTVTNVTESSATITWTGGSGHYNVEYKKSSDENWTPILSNTTDLTYTFTNLDAITPYQVRVQSVCEGDVSSWKSDYFTTPCGVFSLPYTYGFEEESDMDCWNLENCDNGTGRSSSALHEGNYGFQFHYNTNPPQYLISPMFTGTTGMTVSFYFRNSSDTWAETFQVGYSTTTNATSAFTWGTEITANDQNTWMRYEADFPAGTKYVAVKLTSNDMYYLYLDDFTFEVNSSCVKPSNLATSNITTQSAEINWTENGQASTWQICLNNDETNLITANSTSYNLTGLNIGTDYSVKVRANCGDEVSDWSNAVTFSTDATCPAPTNVTASNITQSSATISWNSNTENYNVMYREATVTGTTLDEIFFDGFESGISNWTSYANSYSNDATNWQQFDATQFTAGTNYSGNYVAMSRSYGGGEIGDVSVDNWFVSPQMTLGDVVKFWVSGDDAGWQEYYAVYVSTGTNAISDFVMLEAPELAPGDGTWSERTVNLGSYAGQQGYIAIRHTDNGKDYLLIDNFGVYGTINTYTYGTEHTLTSTTNSCNLTGLSAETTYEVSVQADCGSTDGTSRWTRVYMTTPDACSAPTDLVASNITANTAMLGWSDNQDSYNVRYRKVYFHEDFESETMPTGWTSIDANQDGNTWYIGHATTHSGNNGAANISYIYNTSGTSPDDYLVSPMLDLQGTLRVWLSGYGERYQENFAIYLSTTGNSAADFTTTLIGETNTTNEYVEYTADLSSYAGQQGYIAIRHFNCSDQYYLYVDDFGLYGSENWTTENANTATVTLTGLSAETDYEWQVQGVNCDGQGSTTLWSEVASFETREECRQITAADLPYIEGFENITTSTEKKTGIMPTCWTLAYEDYTPMSDTARPQVFYADGKPASGDYCLFMFGMGILAMPQLADDLDISTLKMSFALRQHKLITQLQVGVMSDLSDETTFTPLATFDNGASTEVQHYVVDFRQYTGNDSPKYIAFRNVLAPGHDQQRSVQYIDDISIYVANSADDPDPDHACGIEVPYTQNFDNLTSNTSTLTGVNIDCWTFSPDLEGAAAPQVSFSPDYAVSGNYTLLLSGKGIYALPQITNVTDLTGLTLSFSVRQRKYAHRIAVGVMTDPNDPNTFVEIARFYNGGEYNNPVTHSVDLSAYSGNGKYIAFRNVTTNADAVSQQWIDDISIFETPAITCGITVPYEQGFESGIPECWTFSPDLEGAAAPQISGEYASSGANSLYMSGMGTFALPEITNVNDLSGLTLTFSVRQRKFAHRIAVGVMTDPSDPNTFVEIERFYNGGVYNMPVEHSVDLSAYSGNGRHIAFRNVVTNSNTVSQQWIDDISIDLTPARSAEVEQNGYEYTENDAANEALAPLGVDGFDINTFTVYPNPTSGALTLGMEAQRVEVNSLTGQKVAVFENTSRIDISNLPAGVYILKVTLPQGQAVRKIVKR